MELMCLFTKFYKQETPLELISIILMTPEESPVYTNYIKRKMAPGEPPVKRRFLKQ